jgi:isoleucyl-tRNA synthetase
LLKNANDWNLSRSRFWGIPLPIWRTEDNQEEILIGSVEELYEIENRLQQVSNNKSFPRVEIGNMAESNYDLVDLHKMLSMKSPWFLPLANQ